MKLYKDKALTEEIKTLDFGIVKAGQKKTFEFYAFNDSNAELTDIHVTTQHNELSIIGFPGGLQPMESKMFQIEWSPSVTLKEGLKTKIRIEATELWS